ncbi:MAG TPA: thiol reductant ABC exporter subunit CydD [Acidimicrobiales bacterium]|nr:thiol reductant ABC exporter subunit CydD [Acidimicrobiales bacterium]
MERPSALLARLGRVTPLVRRSLAVAVVLGVVATGAVIVQAVALASLLGALFDSPTASLVHGTAWFLGASAVRALGAGLADPLASRLGAPLRRELRRCAFARVVRLGAPGSPDAAVQLVTRGVDATESFVATYVPAMVLATIAPLVLLVWFALTDVVSLVIVAVSVALLPVFMVLLGLAAKEKMDQRWREQQTLAGYFGDVVRGMATLKAFNRSRVAVSSLDDAGASLERTTMATLRVAFLSGFALELLSSLATALVALVLGIRLLNGSIGLSVALAVLLLTPEVFLPLRRSSANFHASAVGVGAAGELLDLLERPLPASTGACPEAPPAIQLVDLAMVHEGRRPLFEPLTATIAPGSMVAVLGPSGSGKSTLLRVLCGLREPSAGAVLVNGVDLASMDRDQWQRRVAWLPQDPWLPGETVGDAVRLGDQGIDEEEIRSTMTRVGLDLDLATPLGEGSRELSAGQRRRVALVRALVRHPLVLVLDEPLAHLDLESAHRVASLLGTLTMTRVVATHRDLDVDGTINLSRTAVDHARA